MYHPRGARGPQINAPALRALRLQRGWTQAELAARAGMDQSHVGRLENGTRSNPAPRISLALAQALGVPLGALLMAEYAEVPG